MYQIAKNHHCDSLVLITQKTEPNNGNNNNNNNNTATVIPVEIRATGTISKSPRQYLSNKTGSTKLWDLKKQPYWALHTYYGKCQSTKHI
jgi:hypothetical protein